MTALQIVLGIILLVAAVFLIVAVLMQSGKSHNLSGSIAGGAETFFGKTKGKTIDKMLSKLTTIVAIVFVLIVIFVYVSQDDTDLNELYNNLTTTAADTEASTGPEDTGIVVTEGDNAADTDAPTDAE